jgi:hypothetical protein
MEVDAPKGTRPRFDVEVPVEYMIQYSVPPAGLLAFSAFGCKAVLLHESVTRCTSFLTIFLRRGQELL